MVFPLKPDQFPWHPMSRISIDLRLISCVLLNIYVIKSWHGHMIPKLRYKNKRTIDSFIKSNDLMDLFHAKKLIPKNARNN